MLSFERKQGKLSHNSQFWCCTGETATLRNTVRMAAEEVLSKDYSCSSRDVVLFCLHVWVLGQVRSLAVSPRKPLPCSKPCPTQQHQTRKHGMTDLNLHTVISICKKNLDPLWTVHPQENLGPRFSSFLRPNAAYPIDKKGEGKKTTQMAIKHWNVSAAGGRLFFIYQFILSWAEITLDCKVRGGQ